MNKQIKQSIDKFKIPRPKVTIGEGLESAYLIPESELLSLLKLVAEEAHKRGALDVDKWSYTKHHIHNLFEDYWKTLTEQL